jgi:hypothetical protein
MRLNAHLREIITRIEIFAVGHAALADEDADPKTRDGEDFAEYVDAIAGEVAPELIGSPVFHAFLRDVTKRRMSKEGRFYRVHFKTGAVRDFVPPGSIATGVALAEEGKAWRWVTPGLDTLWEDFKNTRQKRPSARG